ncbi:hypothetical protein BH10PLA2_BH10PLA2_18220 [soil metagenome]
MASRITKLAFLLSLALAGCETTQQRVARDPLLLTKRGILGNPANAAPSALLVSAEPLPPDLPANALVSSRQPAALLREQATALARQKLESPGDRLPSAAEKTLVAQPVPTPPVASAPPVAPVTPESTGRPPVNAMPVKRQIVRGIYGAAADHSWLQGTVESFGNDGAILRYGHPWVAGPDALRVLLQPDDRLKDLRRGDVIRVEGEETENPANRGLPRYQFKTLIKVSQDS